MGRDVQIYNSTQQKNTLADVQAAISWRERTSYPTPTNFVKTKNKGHILCRYAPMQN